jgi:hypothetical protein
VLRAGVYLFAGFTFAALAGWWLWYAQVWIENIREDVDWVLHVRVAAALCVALPGPLALACALAALAAGSRPRWWEYLIGGLAVLAGAAGALTLLLLWLH